MQYRLVLILAISAFNASAAEPQPDQKLIELKANAQAEGEAWIKNAFTQASDELKSHPDQRDQIILKLATSIKIRAQGPKFLKGVPLEKRIALFKTYEYQRSRESALFFINYKEAMEPLEERATHHRPTDCTVIRAEIDGLEGGSHNSKPDGSINYSNSTVAVLQLLSVLCETAPH